MTIVRSKDGTSIAYEKAGSGPALIIVDGALCYRAFGPSRKLVPHLKDKFTVFTYDRRGRGESGNSDRYDVQREVEDLEAVIDEAGGKASVLGFSSGAALALEAANRGADIERLALYEPPFIVDDSRTPTPEDFIPRLNDMIAGDRRGEAVRHFMKLVGMPSIMVQAMRFFPGWRKLKAVSHTLPHDLAIVAEHQRGLPLPEHRWDSAAMPTTVIEGGKSPLWMRNSMKALAAVLPNADLTTLNGQNHMVKAAVLAPIVKKLLAAQGNNGGIYERTARVSGPGNIGRTDI